MVVREDGDAAAQRVGQRLTSELRVTRLIAVGGSAAVYEAERAGVETVAVKVLHARWCDDPIVRGRFVREACLVNRVDHPGIVRVIEHGTAPDGAPFLSMERLHGETAAEKRARLRGRLPELEALCMADRALSVLHAAHAVGILHRDISPSNLFLASDGSLRVLDFGNAGLQRSHVPATLTRTGEIFGTTAYMSPELALGAHRCVDVRSDVYALGATLFRLLSSEWVFPSSGHATQRLAVMTLPARSLGRAMPDAHPDTVRLVDGALRYERSERWQTAAEMQAACRAAMTAIVERRPSNGKGPDGGYPGFEDRTTERELPGPELI